jgi:hypothetical protein
MLRAAGTGCPYDAQAKRGRAGPWPAWEGASQGARVGRHPPMQRAVRWL